VRSLLKEYRLDEADRESSVCIIAIVKTIYLIASLHAKDPTYYKGISCIWASVETNAAIVCACLPGLTPYFTRWSRKPQTPAYNSAATSEPSGGNSSGISSTGGRLATKGDQEYHELMRELSGNPSREAASARSGSEAGGGRSIEVLHLEDIA
jgi:hypothetical protein